MAPTKVAFLCTRANPTLEKQNAHAVVEVGWVVLVGWVEVGWLIRPGQLSVFWVCVFTIPTLQPVEHRTASKRYIEAGGK